MIVDDREMAKEALTAKPSYLKEFRDASSVYKLEKLEDSEEISDDEEFRQARNIQIFEEDATEVMKNEQGESLRLRTGMY